ncbi:MAG TPA: hypothetical protein VFR87_00215, partial [Nocardioidaceae bacterium]|nr:hypothetical protein [Nocardioidaceae bacterium]
MNRSRDDEYAEAYRRGYERARQGAEPTVRLDEMPTEAHRVPVQRDGEDGQEPTQQIGFLAGAFAASTYDDGVDEPGVQSDASHERTPDTGRRDERRRRRPRVAALAGLALVLVVGAFGIGRMFADDGMTTGSGAGESEPTGTDGQQAYEGAVRAVRVASASATCQSAGSVDAAGNPVTYEPAKAHDSDLTTAWRCDGTGIGQALTLELPQQTSLSEVGLVPGYAKTDPANGVDRYAENNRITRVRWRFEDGTTFVQRMSADPDDRSMRTMRIPVTE